MFSWLLQEAEVLKTQLAAMQEAQPMMAAQQTRDHRSPLRSLYGSPIGSVHTALPTVSTAQVCTPTAQHGGKTSAQFWSSQSTQVMLLHSTLQIHHSAYE